MTPRLSWWGDCSRSAETRIALNLDGQLHSHLPVFLVPAPRTPQCGMLCVAGASGRLALYRPPPEAEPGHLIEVSTLMLSSPVCPIPPVGVPGLVLRLGVGVAHFRSAATARGEAQPSPTRGSSALPSSRSSPFLLTYTVPTPSLPPQSLVPAALQPGCRRARGGRGPCRDLVYSPGPGLPSLIGSRR